MKCIYILGVSGGPDSVYLLYQLLKKGQKPILAHLNHQLRGRQSDEDEQFVRNLGKKHRLIVEVQRIDISAWAKQHKKSIEEAGRILRYRFFEKIRQKHAATAILTAHHLNDNLETVLMNQKRGCGLRGIIGMQKKNGFIVRPLLNTPKEKILAHLHRHQIPYRIDPSNDDRNYTRNRIRHEVIPKMLKKNPHLLRDFQKERQKNILRYKTLQQKTVRWLSNLSFPRKRESMLIHFPASHFQKLSAQRQKFLLQHLYETFYGSTHELTSKRIEEIQNLIGNNRTGKEKAFGKEVIVRIEYEKVIFSKPHAKIAHRTLTPLPKNLHSKHLLYVDPQAIKGQKLFVRTWQPGDRFQPSGLKGSKKVQDFFVDNKIPRERRAHIPILVTQDDVIVAVGNRVDEKFKVTTKNTKTISLKILKTKSS